MNAAATTTPSQAPAQPPPAEACPLCGAPLAPAQEWCLRCGAAARTRLAAAPNWKAPLTALAIVGALSLGAIAAALVKLAGDTGPPPPAVTRTVTAASAAAPTTALPPTATAPGAATTGTAVAPGQPGTATQPAATATTTTPTATQPTKGSGGTGASKRKLTPAQEKLLKELNLSGQIK